MAIFAYFNIIDSKGDVSRVEIPFPSGTVLGAVVDAMDDIADLIQAMVAGGLQSAGISFEVDVSATWGAVAGLAADVQEKAEFVFNTAGGYLKRLNIPTVLESIFNPGSAEVDLGNSSVEAFIDFMEDGIVSGAETITPSDYRGADVLTLRSAKENWGKRRR